jgi:hypothetical protein
MDIYVPTIVAHIKGQNESIVNAYRRDGSTFTLIPSLAEYYSVSSGMKSRIPGMSRLTSKFRSESLERINQQKQALEEYVGPDNLKLDTNLYFGQNKALFLKAGEEHQYFFSLEMKNPRYKEGEYLIAFEPDFSKLAGENYPEMVMGYKKYIPTEVKTNPLYIHLINEYGEVMRRK